MQRRRNYSKIPEPTGAAGLSCIGWAAVAPAWLTPPAAMPCEAEPDGPSPAAKRPAEATARKPRFAARIAAAMPAWSRRGAKAVPG